MPTPETNPEGRSPGSPEPSSSAALSLDLSDPERLLSLAQARSLHADALRVLAHVHVDPIRGPSGSGAVPLSGRVEVRFTSDAVMAEAHLRHCGVAGTTDVITFDLSGPAGPSTAAGALDAELLVCADEARRQADARGHDVLHELLLYILHGVLHCLGHNDLTPDDARLMHEREDRILSAAGFGPIYSRPLASASAGGAR